jgi:hypothetical protein
MHEQDPLAWPMWDMYARSGNLAYPSHHVFMCSEIWPSLTRSDNFLTLLTIDGTR